jgi:hypothetical protein
LDAPRILRDPATSRAGATWVVATNFEGFTHADGFGG